MKYKVHRFDLKIGKDPMKLKHILNGPEGEVISIMPHVAFKAFWSHVFDFVLVTGKLNSEQINRC